MISDIFFASAQGVGRLSFDLLIFGLGLSFFGLGIRSTCIFYDCVSSCYVVLHENCFSHIIRGKRKEVESFLIGRGGGCFFCFFCLLLR